MLDLSSTFKDSFSNAFKQEVVESVLDFPTGESLCSDVWVKKNNSYELTKEAYDKAKVIIEWAIKKMALKHPTARIVGSICSNTYNKDSDIDIHLSADNVTKSSSEELNKELMAAFKTKFVDKKEGMIKGHPFEVYLQYNVHQDEMSVGCYDFNNKKWLSGPELRDEKFNPYEEYFDGIQKHISSLTDDIRIHVLKCGEIASTILKLVDNVKSTDKFLTKMNDALLKATKKARELFVEVRKKRSIASNPTSKADALNKRDSMEWKIADSSFKFLDKLGYIAALLAIAKSGEEEIGSTKTFAENVIDAIRDNLFNKARTGYADINKD